MSLTMLLGLVMGGLWQILNRRDLADRLLFPALVCLVAVVSSALSPDGSYFVGELLYAVGLVTGLVLAEQLLRWRRGPLAKSGEAAASPQGSVAQA